MYKKVQEILEEAGYNKSFTEILDDLEINYWIDIPEEGGINIEIDHQIIKQD